MPGRITIENRIIQRVGIAVQPLRPHIIHRIRGGEAREGGVVVAGTVVVEAAGVVFFAGVGVLRSLAAALVFGFFAEGGVGQAAGFEAVHVGDSRGAAQVVGMYLGEDTVALLGHTLAVEGRVCDVGGDRAILRMTHDALSSCQRTSRYGGQRFAHFTRLTTFTSLASRVQQIHQWLTE